MIFPLKPPFSSGVFHCDVWLQEAIKNWRSKGFPCVPTDRCLIDMFFLIPACFFSVKSILLSHDVIPITFGCAAPAVFHVAGRLILCAAAAGMNALQSSAAGSSRLTIFLRARKWWVGIHLVTGSTFVRYFSTLFFCYQYNCTNQLSIRFFWSI